MAADGDGASQGRRFTAEMILRALRWYLAFPVSYRDPAAMPPDRGARHGIRVNAICPGPVETRMMRSLEAQRNPADPDAVAEANRQGMPTGRYSLPQEVANTVLYLCSELAGNMTGTQIVVDGGRSASGGAPAARR